MGNRAVITTAPFKPGNIGIYVHWNGGQESIEGFLRAAKTLGFRDLDTDDSYALARLTQAIATYFGGTQSIGIGRNDQLDCHNGDNGTWLIGGDWKLVGRKHGAPPVATLGEAGEAKAEEIAADIVKKMKESVDAG